MAKGEKELMFSINKMYEMYLLLLLIFDELFSVAQNRIEEGKLKKLPSEEDLNPNLKFVENKLLTQVRTNRQLLALRESEKINWSSEAALMRRLMKEVRDSEEYQSYMSEAESSYQSDKNFLIRIFKKYIVNDEQLQFFFDERSIFWVDDLDLVASMVIKTLKSFEETSDEFHPLLPLWKEEEEEKDFVKRLFRKTIVDDSELMDLIKQHSSNWEIDRIALIDIILMKMALTEARQFSQIPVKVTLNEYIEISKYYSTPKSNGFINGVLDKLFVEMRERGQIKKMGRGLIN